MRVLFVNCCTESKTTSKTYILANSFIETFIHENPDAQITQLDLVSERLVPLTYHDFIMRERGKWQKANYAQQIVEHDKIIIAAPVCDWGSPSLLRVYIEYICLLGSTYIHTEDGYSGLCLGKQVLYVSAMNEQIASGISSDAKYIQDVFKLFGIDDFKQLHVESTGYSQATGKSINIPSKKTIVEMAASW